MNQVTVLIGMSRIVRSTLRHSALADFGALPVTFVGLVLRFSRVFLHLRLRGAVVRCRLENWVNCLLVLEVVALSLVSCGGTRGYSAVILRMDTFG